MIRRRDIPGRIPSSCVEYSAEQTAASKGESWGWDGYRVRMLLVGGLLCLALFVVVELQVEHPLLDIRLLTNHQLTVSVIVGAMNFVNVMITVFYVPVFLQQAQGKGALDAGLLIMPMALVMIVTVPLSGALAPILGPRLLGVVGIALVVWSNLLNCEITPQTTHEQIIFWTCLRGAGLGISMPALMVCGLNTVRSDRTNQASAIINVCQQLGAAFSLAVLGALVSGQQAQRFADRSGLLAPDSELSKGANALVAQTGGVSDSLLVSFYQAGMNLRIDTMASAYGDLFWIMTLASVAYLWLPLLMKESSRFALGAAPRPAAAPTAPVASSPNGAVNATRTPADGPHRTSPATPKLPSTVD